MHLIVVGFIQNLTLESLQVVVSTAETTLIGRISDVVQSGRGSDFVA